MTEDKILLTARYVEGDLDQAESKQFEERLLTDTKLQQCLADYKRVEENLKMHFADDQQRDQLKVTLKQFNKQHFTIDKPINNKVISLKPYMKWISVAAVLIIGLFIWAPWNNDLYKQYANDNKMLVTERGQAPTSELDQAATFYNRQEFEKAAVILAELYKKDNENALTAFYYGSSLAALNQSVKAREILEKLAAGNSVYKFDAAYTIALNYLKNDDKANCKLWLEKIPAGTAKYEKSQELLKKL